MKRRFMVAITTVALAVSGVVAAGAPAQALNCYYDIWDVTRASNFGAMTNINCDMQLRAAIRVTNPNTGYSEMAYGPRVFSERTSKTGKVTSSTWITFRGYTT